MDERRLILLVEDNENDEILAIRAIRKSNLLCRVEVARDGIEAIEYLFASDNPRPRLVLLDLKLPRMNGCEVLGALRSDMRTHDLPIVMFTSSDDESDITGCIDRGANSFVRKPVDFAEYVERVGMLAQYWLTINVPSPLVSAKLVLS